jgi:DNA-binding CsgD family transcriptional regulator
VVGDTAPAMAWLARLLPRDDGLPPVPAVVLNVAAQLLATEAGADAHPAMSRVHVTGRGWITARAQRLGGDGRIAVTLAPVSAAERAEIYCRALGLTAREEQVLGLLGAGRDTRAVASELHLAPTTVQDHLKSVFAKTGTRSRGSLVAQAYGGADGVGGA